MLQTHENGHQYPVGYWSRTVLSAKRNYSTTEKEYIAIVLAVRTLRPYLERKQFTVNADHYSLKCLMKIVHASGRLARRPLRLAEYDFSVSYVKGIKKFHADALSRITSTGGSNVPIDENIPFYSVLDLEEYTRYTEKLLKTVMSTSQSAVTRWNPRLQEPH